MGTVGRPIAYNAKTADLNMSFVVAAVLTGAMFRDGCSMISDTTIAATGLKGQILRGQKFRTNAWIYFSLTLITLSLIPFLARAALQLEIQIISDKGSTIRAYSGSRVGLNVFAVLIIGIISASAVGVGTGAIGLIWKLQLKIWSRYWV